MNRARPGLDTIFKTDWGKTDINNFKTEMSSSSSEQDFDSEDYEDRESRERGLHPILWRREIGMTVCDFYIDLGIPCHMSHTVLRRHCGHFVLIPSGLSNASVTISQGGTEVGSFRPPIPQCGHLYWRQGYCGMKWQYKKTFSQWLEVYFNPKNK